MVIGISDQEASKIAQRTYDRDVKNIRVRNDQGAITSWKTIQPIQDKDTGLNGYVLKNPETGKVVISFEGTQLNEGFSQALNDINEDIYGIFFGRPSHVKKSSVSKLSRHTCSRCNAFHRTGEAERR